MPEFWKEKEWYRETWERSFCYFPLLRRVFAAGDSQTEGDSNECVCEGKMENDALWGTRRCYLEKSDTCFDCCTAGHTHTHIHTYTEIQTHRHHTQRVFKEASTELSVQNLTTDKSHTQTHSLNSRIGRGYTDCNQQATHIFIQNTHMWPGWEESR